MLNKARNEFEQELNEICGYSVFFPMNLVKKHDEECQDFFDDLILCQDFEEWSVKMEKKLGFQMFELDYDNKLNVEQRRKIMIEALKLENYSRDDFMIRNWTKPFLNEEPIEEVLKRFFCLMNDKNPNYLD